MSQPQEPPAYGCYRHPDRPTYIRCQRCGRPICGDCMISAAVGFQCPECVATGARQTRQNEGVYGGTRSRNPQATTLTLIAVNVVVWVGILLTGGYNSRLFDALALMPAGRCGSVAQPDSFYPDAGRAVCEAMADGRWLPGVADGWFWQVVTSAFTHVDVIHIGLNLINLWFLGPSLEQVLGRGRFLAVCGLSALGASAAVMWLSNPQSQTNGASGIVFGLLGALGVIAYKVHGDVRTILILLGVNLAYSFIGAGISWQGHIGGLLAGALVTALIAYAPRESRRRFQVVGMSALAVVLLVLIVFRALQLA